MPVYSTCKWCIDAQRKVELTLPNCLQQWLYSLTNRPSCLLNHKVQLACATGSLGCIVTCKIKLLICNHNCCAQLYQWEWAQKRKTHDTYVMNFRTSKHILIQKTWRLENNSRLTHVCMLLAVLANSCSQQAMYSGFPGVSFPNRSGCSTSKQDSFFCNSLPFDISNNSSQSMNTDRKMLKGKCQMWSERSALFACHSSVLLLAQQTWLNHMRPKQKCIQIWIVYDKSGLDIPVSCPRPWSNKSLN